MKKTTRFSLFIFFALFSYFFVITVFAAEVTQVKGNKIMIQDLTATVGEKFFVISAGGKKIGIVTIKQAKGGKAIAEITKGRAEVGATVSKGTGPSPQTTNNAEASAPATPKSTSRMGFLWGLGSHGFAMDIAATATSPSRVSSSMTGMTFLNFKGFYDYPLNDLLNIRAAAGIESFTAKSTLNVNYCNGSTACSVEYTYLGLEGMGQFNYMTGGTRGWIGAGYSFLVAMQKKKTIANLEDSSTNQMILFSTGLDFNLDGGSFVPVALDYGLFPGSSDVKVSSIYLRIGYGW